MAISTKMPSDPFNLLTESMVQFQMGMSNIYTTRDGFKLDHNGTRFTATEVTISCLACGKNKKFPWSDVQTKESELTAAEAAHWQMNHREKCRPPASRVGIK